MKSSLLSLLIVGVVAAETPITQHNVAVTGSTLCYLEAGHRDRTINWFSELQARVPTGR